jgi:triosephosphate isomerase
MSAVQVPFASEMLPWGDTTRKLVIGNWKMNGSRSALSEFARALTDVRLGCDAALCVPYTLLGTAQMALSGTDLRWGAQDCSEELAGAHTGDVSAQMISEFHASYVIVGHADRRRLHGETDGQVAIKVKRVLAAGMTPVICIGESSTERDANQTRVVLKRQLVQVMRALGHDLRQAVIAYEPLWAIGSGEMAPLGLIEDALGSIAEIIDFNARHTAHGVRMLYGGSLSPRTAGSLLGRRYLGGALVGGASLRADDFLSICRSAATCL